MRSIPPSRFIENQLTAASAVPWEDFKKELLLNYDPSLRAKRTRECMESMFRRLDELRRLDEETHEETSEPLIRSTEDLTVATLIRLVAGRPAKNSPNSTRTLLRHVKSACSYAEMMGYLRISPFRIRDISSFARAVPSRRKKHASREEIKRVLDLMREQAKADGWRGWRAKRLFAVTATLAYTGARAGEVLWLQVGDVDVAEGVIWIVSRKEHMTKTEAAEAPIPMPPPLIPILTEWLKFRMSRPPGFKVSSEECPWLFPNLRGKMRAPWNGGSPGTKPRDRMAIVAAQAGVLGFCPLVLRHSMATHLLHWGAGPGTVKRILRHSTERTAQQWYTHNDIPNLKAAVADVEF